MTKAISSSSAESDSELNKLGNYKLNKLGDQRQNKYDSQFDVSMNEKLINRFQKKTGRTLEKQPSGSRSFESGGLPNNSIDQENIHDKMAKIIETEEDGEINKIRQEAQCRICLGEEEDEEIEENPLISP